MRFKRQRVQKRVAEDLAALGDFRNWHGIAPDNLASHLVALRHERFRKSSETGLGGYVGLWVVLDEWPGSDDGYLVAFCPRRDSYGLASKPNSRRWGSLVGFYGTLGETLESM